jgi:hypothetical protein
MILAQKQPNKARKKIGDSEISTSQYCHLILNEGTRNTNWKDKQRLEQVVLGKLDIDRYRIEN